VTEVSLPDQVQREVQELEKVLSEVTTKFLRREVKVAFKEYSVKMRESILGVYYWDVYVFSFDRELTFEEAKKLKYERRWRYIKFRVAQILQRPFALRLLIWSAKRRTYYGFIIYALRKEKK